MSKAILIINMPKDCPFCPVAHYNKLDEFTGCDIVGGKRYAMTTEKGYKDTNYKPDWCPLKSMPEKKEDGKGEFNILDCVTFPKETIDMARWQIEQRVEYDTRRLMAKGYNDCIDEILGE